MRREGGLAAAALLMGPQLLPTRTLLPLIVGLETGSDFFSHPAVNGLVIIAISGLMISRIPTPAMKQVKIPGRYVGFVLLGVGAFAAFLISTPWITLGVSGLAYLAAIPYGVKLYRRHERESPAAEAIEDEQAEDEQAEDELDDEDEDETENQVGIERPR